MSQLPSRRISGLRVLLVTRRFWPLVGEPEGALADLACGLARHGARPAVLTAQWTADWPRQSCFDTVPVYRVPLSGENLWRLPAYLLGLTGWIRRHWQEFDIALVARLREDACTVLRALRRTAVPVAVRAAADDGSWHEQSLVGRSCRRRSCGAAAVIAEDVAVQQLLVSAGYPPARLHTIGDGIPAGGRRTCGSRFDARLALAAANGDLTTAADAPVVVCSTPLRRGCGLPMLVRAWNPVVLRWPSAKLWLIGEGPARDELYRLISDLDLRHSIYMPGTFEDADDVWRAANLFVHPAESQGLPRTVLAAAAAGLPVVARATPAIRQHTVLARHVRLVGNGEPASWSSAIIRVLEEPPHREQRTAQRRAVLVEHSMTQMVQRYLALFEQLLAEAGERDA